MDFKLLLTVFTTVFAAEMADKTQVATFCTPPTPLMQK